MFSVTVATCSAATSSRASASPRDASSCAFAYCPAVMFRLRRGVVYAIAVTVGRAASTAAASTGVASTGVVSSTTVSLSVLVSSTGTISSAAISSISADANAGTVTRETSLSLACDTTVYPSFDGFDAIISAPTESPVIRPSCAMISASLPPVERLNLNVA